MATVGALGLSALLSSPANAAFPGTDGPVVFSGASGFFSFHGGCRRFGIQLYEVTPGSTQPVEVTCSRGFNFHPFVSPDGSEVVFTGIGHSGVTQLFTVPLETVPSNRPPKPTLVSSSSSDSDDDASWSPEGDGTIVFTRTAPGQPGQLFFENVDDPGSATPLFPSPTGFDDSQAVYDPTDPNVIVFVRSTNGDDHIMRYDTSSKTLLDLSAVAGGSVNDAEPDFSPTGTTLVFQTDSPCGRQILTMDVDGSNRQPVFTSDPVGGNCHGSEGDPRYSPQGDAIAFDRGGPGGERIYTVPANASGGATGPATPLAARIFLAIGTDWGPTDGPPVEAPETSLPVLLPVAGAAVGAGSLLIRQRRRAKATRRPG